MGYQPTVQSEILGIAIPRQSYTPILPRSILYAKEEVPAHEIAEELKKGFGKFDWSNPVRTAADILAAATPFGSPASYVGPHSFATAVESKNILRQDEVPDWPKYFSGSLLHDIGKIGVGEPSIHDLDRRYTTEDIAQMRKHAVRGAIILEGVNAPTEVIDLSILHQERPDGEGYPFGLKKDEIPFAIQALSIGDALDAMGRKYGGNGTIEKKAVQLLRGVDQQFHPELVRRWWENNKALLPPRLKGGFDNAVRFAREL